MTKDNTAAEQEEINYGEQLIWRLVGAKITTIGANANGEILLSTDRDGAKTDLVIGKDDDGEITVYEIQPLSETEVTND